MYIIYITTQYIYYLHIYTVYLNVSTDPVPERHHGHL